MKTVAQVLRKVVKPAIDVDPLGFKFEIHTGVYADDGGALRRTRIKSLSAIVRNVSSDHETAFNPLMVGVLSVPDGDYFIGLEGDGETPLTYAGSIDEVLARSVWAVSVDVVRGLGIDPLTENETGIVSANSNVNQVVVMPNDAYDALTCGKDFYVWVAGGGFSGSARVTIDVERVEITQDEYMRYYAGSC
jgi:hypothetical protein